MKNAWKPGSQAKATASTAIFITHLASVFDVLVNCAMKNAMLASAPGRLSAF
jgi:hypothetical protein